MEGLSRATAIGPQITLQGERFTVSGYLTRHLPEAEAEIIKQRGNPAQMVREAAIDYSRFQTEPVFQKLRQLAEQKAKEDGWTDEQKQHVEQFLKDAYPRIDKSLHYRELMSVAFDELKRWQFVPWNEAEQYLLGGSFSGFAMRLWFAIRKQPDGRTYSLSDVIQLLGDEVDDRIRKEGADGFVNLMKEINEAIDQAGGQDELGNSTDSSPTS